MRLAARLCLLVLIVAAIACGKKGNPRPPEEAAPSAVRSLAARGEVSGVMLSWLAPETTVEDNELRDLAGFVVRRNEYVRGERPSFEEIAEQKLNDNPAEKAYVFRDKDVEPGKTYEYTVTPFNVDGAEGPSATVLRVTFLGETSRVEGL